MDEICKSILTSSGDDDMPDPLEPRQLSPLSPNTETSLLEIMDRRQNALLQELDGLNERILALTTEFAAQLKLAGQHQVPEITQSVATTFRRSL